MNIYLSVLLSTAERDISKELIILKDLITHIANSFFLND